MLFNIWEQGKVQKSQVGNMFNTQTMLPISEIKYDTLILKDGGTRAILKITGLNLDLRNFEEQQIVLEQYKRFLNGLDFPVQILIRNTYLDLSDYLVYMRTNIDKVENTILQKQWENYIKFLEDIDAKRGLIYVKEFYIIIPYYQGEQDNKQINKGRVTKLLDVLNAKDTVEKIVEKYRWFLKGKTMLETRCNLIIEGLGSMGIHAEKINTTEIINLLFNIYNPLLHSSQGKFSEDVL